MPFQHDLAGGSGNLTATQIQSPNYVPGTSGWIIRKNGTAEFQGIVLPSGQGVAVFIQSTAPTTTHVGDLWYDTSNGMRLNQWSGSAWTAYQISGVAIASGGVGTTQIANAAITNALIAASAVAASNIQNGAITTTQINAAAGILGSQLAAAAGITGGQIASGTITGTNLASSVTARSLGGITTTIASTAPSSPTAGDLWLDSGNGYQVKRWDGSSWVAVSWNAGNVISAATITGSLVAASTITGGNIAAGTITASNIAAATITANLLAAGIVVAGIVNGTLIEGATIVADGTSGQILVYQGTAASGNLIGAWSGTAGSDSFSNAFIAGMQIGLNTSNQILLEPNVNSAFNVTTTIAGTLQGMLAASTTDTSEVLPGFLGGVLLGTGTATKMATVLTSPLAATPNTGAAIILEAENDGATDTAILTFGTITTPDNSTEVFTPILTLGPYYLLLYGGSSGTTVVTKTSGSGTIAIPAGVSTAKAEVWGGGGGGGGGFGGGSGLGGGGGGGEYAAEASLAVTGGGTVSYAVGAAGAGGLGGTTGNNGANGSAGGNSTLTGTTVTVTGHGGSLGVGATSTSGSGAGGAGGTGSTNTTHHDGGAGGTFSSGTFGPGGGGSGGTSATGNAGDTGSSGAGGAAVSGGGPGGKGGSVPGGNGAAPTSAPGGGGGGGARGTVTPQSPGGAGGSGKVGQVRLTYVNGNPSIQLSIASASGTDQFGNSFPKGLHMASAGVFQYSAAPAAGNMIAAMADVAGTDSSSNAFGAAFTGSIAAFQPGSSPTAVETWHNVTPPTGWTGTCRYKKLAESNFAVVDFELANAGASGNVVIFATSTLPASMRPTSQRDYPLSMTSNTAPANSNQRFFIKTDGSMSTFALPASTTGISATQIYPLD